MQFDCEVIWSLCAQALPPHLPSLPFPASCCPLVLNCSLLVVDLQPPAILKLQARFAVGVRLLLPRALLGSLSEVCFKLPVPSAHNSHLPWTTQPYTSTLQPVLDANCTGDC